MINELRNLAVTLDSMNISSADWHRKYKELPTATLKSPCIRIWLDDDGSVCGFEALPLELVPKLRKYGDNQGSFPAFNISPLYRLTDADCIEALKQIEKGKAEPNIEEIKSWSYEDNRIAKVQNQTQRSLFDRSEELHGKIGNDCAVMARLFEILPKSADEFGNSLEKCIFNKLSLKEDVSLALKLLFHKGDIKKEHEKDTGAKISVIFDVKNRKPSCPYPVASEKTTAQINQLLLKIDKADCKTDAKADGSADKTESDAFGMPFINPNEPMPGVKLGGFSVILRSMFKEQQCQYRYRRAGDGSYPISKENRASVKRALEWISAPDRRQITWEKTDKDECVFIYPSKLPEVPVKFASIFGTEQNGKTVNTEARFEAAAKDFIKALRGLPVDKKPDMMRIFTLRKIDKGRTKVVFTHNTTPEQLIFAAESWSKGCHNLPELNAGEIITPFPLQIADIINAVWKQDGKRADGKTPVRRVKYYQGMELLLDILPSEAISSFLHIELENSSGLINYLGNMIQKKSKDENGKLKKEAARSCAVLGLLLYKLNERKENFMEELAYLLGQLLQVADRLHTLYCKVKRNEDIPPQLAGSALFITAGEMPYQALSQLSVRMSPYISWAKQYRYLNVDDKGKESRRAAWLLGLFTAISDKLNPQMDKSVRFGDFERAKLFIGYMASLPKRKTKISAEENNSPEGGNEYEQ